MATAARERFRIFSVCLCSNTTNNWCAKTLPAPDPCFAVPWRRTEPAGSLPPDSVLTGDRRKAEELRKKQQEELARQQLEQAEQQARQQKEQAAQQARQQMAQYRFLGYLTQQGEHRAFLGKGQALFIVRLGETVEGKIQVAAIDASAVKLRETTTNVETTLPLTKTIGGPS